MLTRRGLFALAFAAWLAAGCATAPHPEETAEQLQQRLIAQADAWDKAIVRKDLAGIEANIGPQFFQIGGDGSVSAHEEFVAGLMDPALTIHPYTVEGLTVRLHGGAALLSATTRMTGTYQGKPFSSHYRYIDTYVKTPQGWKIVAVQITKIPTP
jgi:ketosteroid isomerase-like protein